jgi:hypothetical protein
MLAPAGRIYCLLPNSAHWRFRRKMVRGDWSYDDTGLFDRDHVRFYDTITAGRLATENKLQEMRRWYFPAPGRRHPVKTWLARRRPNLGAYYLLLEWRPATS